MLPGRTSVWVGLALALSLSGCGGEAFSDNIPNIYAGDWDGTYNDILRPATGTIQWLISDNGVMTGKIVRDSDGEEGVFTGSIGSGGQFTGVADFDGTLDFTNIQGFIARSSTSTFGSFSYTFNGSETSASFTLIPAGGT